MPRAGDQLFLCNGEFGKVRQRTAMRAGGGGWVGHASYLIAIPTEVKRLRPHKILPGSGRWQAKPDGGAGTFHLGRDLSGGRSTPPSPLRYATARHLPVPGRIFNVR